MTSWTIRVDWMTHASRNDAELEQLVDTLAGYSPAIGLEHGDEHGPWTYSATITLEEASLRQATAAALRLVEDAAGEKACGIEVLPTHEFDRRLEEPQIPDLVGNVEISEILGVSRQRAAQLQERPGFPPAVATLRTGPVRVRWQVEAWARNWTRKAGRPSAVGAGG